MMRVNLKEVNKPVWNELMGPREETLSKRGKGTKRRIKKYVFIWVKGKAVSSSLRGR